MSDSKSFSRREKRKYSVKSKLVKIRVAATDALVDPLVCSFPGGLPSSLQATNGSTGTSSVRPPKFLWRKSSKKSGVSLVGKDDACLYESQAPEEKQDKRRTKLCVGVFDKKKGTLTLHQAASNGTVFALQQSVPSYLEQESKIATMTAADTRRALFEDFGSAKKRKVLRSQEANRVDVDAVIGAGNLMVDSFLKGESMSESNRLAVEERRNRAEQGEDANIANIQDAVDTATREWRQSFLPTYDQNAVESHEVYNARDMVGDEAWGQVSRVVEACMNKPNVAAALLNDVSDEEEHDDRKRGEWNKSIEVLIRDVPADGPWAKQQLKCAVVLNHFVNLYLKNQRRRFIRPPPEGKSHWFGTPVAVVYSFLDTFATQLTNDDGESGHVMSKANKDKCLVHMLLLWVMAEGGKTMKSMNIKSIADDLQTDVKDASHLLRLAGCTVKASQKTGQTKTSAILLAPLKFPVPKSGGRRGKA
jgi:hypothetical protein